MNITQKKRLLEHLRKTSDGSREMEELILGVEDEARYADCASLSVSIEDLDDLDPVTKSILRSKLNKKSGESFTDDDCQAVADSLGNVLASQFSPYLTQAITYDL